MGKKQRILREAGAILIFVLISGCVPSHVGPAAGPAPLAFPPQAVLQSGDYKGFVAENSAALKSCSQPDKCAAALFNLCFVYSYPKSPYYDPSRALQYISDLVAGSPKSRWAAEAIVWRELIVKEMKGINRRGWIARQRLKSKEADLQNDVAKEQDWQVDRQILQDEIKSKDAIISELTKQLKGSQKIEIEMEKKERELLH